MLVGDVEGFAPELSGMGTRRNASAPGAGVRLENAAREGPGPAGRAAPAPGRDQNQPRRLK